MKPSCAALTVVMTAVSFSQAHAFSASSTASAGATRTSAGARTFLRPANTAANPARGSPFSRTRPATEQALRVRAGEDFDVNAALAELRESANSAAAGQQQSQPLPSKLPSMPSLPTLEFPKNINIPTPTQALDALPKFHLPSFPQLPTPTGSTEFLPTPLLQPLGDTWVFSRLSEAAGKASESSVAAAAKLLPPTPDKYGRLSDQAAESFAHATVQVSSALDALVAANPSLAPAVAHLRSSVTDGASSIGEALAAGNALIPEEYKPLAATVLIGTGATALGMAMAAASEDLKASRGAKNAPLPREYDLPGKRLLCCVCIMVSYCTRYHITPEYIIPSSIIGAWLSSRWFSWLPT